MKLAFWRTAHEPDMPPPQRPLIVIGADGASYRLDEPADVDRMQFALSDDGQRSAVAQLWRRRHKLDH